MFGDIFGSFVSLSGFGGPSSLSAPVRSAKAPKRKNWITRRLFMLIEFRHIYGETLEVNSDKEISEGLEAAIANVDGVANVRKQDRYKLYIEHGKCFNAGTVKANIEATIREFYMDGCPFYMPCRIRFKDES